MNVTEFISEFSDLIPYQFQLSIGGKRKEEIVVDKNLVSKDNFKGKMIPSTKEKGKLVPLQNVSLPINYKFNVDNSLKGYSIVYDIPGECRYESFNPIHMTKKDGTRHCIRILNETGCQVGCIQLELNASGDIKSKTCSYTNLNLTHEVLQMVDIKFCDGKFNREESTIYKSRDFKSSILTTVQTYQVDGVTTGISIVKRRIGEEDGKLLYYFARRETPKNLDGVSHIRSDYENYVIERDLSHFENDFIGKYTGNTILVTEDSRLLVVRTSDDEFNYYTEIDLDGTNPFEGIGPCDCEMEERDMNYLHRLQTSSKEPKFKTKIVDGIEQLVPKNGLSYSDEEIESFQQFRNSYLESFDELSKIKVGKLMQKKNKN